MSNAQNADPTKPNVEQPKTKDPHVQFKFTNLNEALPGVRYVWGTLHYFDGFSDGGNDHSNHMEVDTASSGDTPIVNDEATLSFEFDDAYWNRLADKRDKNGNPVQIHYYLLITYHNDTELAGNAYHGMLTPNKTHEYVVSGPVPTPIGQPLKPAEDAPGETQSAAATQNLTPATGRGSKGGDGDVI
ncbi:MAG: hypothetical protein AAFZ63_17345 [Bacteroidota bacterium]